MNSTALSTKSVKLAVSALLAAVAFMALAFNANSAKASTPGTKINPEFNNVGLNVGTTVAGDISSLVYTPESGPAVGLEAEYTDTAGNFKVDKATGLQFPPISVDLKELVVDGAIGLTEDGSGNYDEATGAMSLNLKLSLRLGVDDLEALGTELGMPLGTGKLTCEFAPLSVKAGTARGWPAEGKAFADKTGFEDGAIAGSWRSKPSAIAIDGEQSICNIIGGFLKPVGGIWLANSTAALTDMPPATEPKPDPETCAEHGLVGVFPKCEEPKCPEGQIGEYPECADPKAIISSVKVGKGKVKAGKTAKVKITVRNTGTADYSGKIALKSSNKQAKVAKSVKVKVAAGKSATVTVKVKTTKKAKGKATITAKVAGKSGKGVLTVQKAKKKRKK